MKKEIIETVYVVKKRLCCDRCKRQIEVGGSFIPGAFQCGENLDGKIATWCSEKCFKMYEKLSLLITAP